MDKWILADSETLDGFSYDEERRILRVRLHTGMVYDYLKATPKLIERLMNAPSKGQFFTAHIRDKLAFKRVS